MKILAKARQHEEVYLKNQDKDKPKFHVTVPIGWLNDPNGFSIYKKEYHLFFQYHPYDTNWGPMHWGHCKSNDLIKWEYLPVALAPDQEYDQDGCFSGSAIEEDNRHILIYTGVKVNKTLDGKEEVKQVQCIADGDGMNYTKWENNPILTPDIITQSVSEADFRDPKIWKYKDCFYLVVACCNAKKQGKIALFSSKDLKKWKYKTMLAENDGTYGRMWECPDFFSLEENQILITSPQDMQAKGFEFHNGNGSIYFVGKFDDESCRFTHGAAKAVDYGLDFYAPQTLETADGRRIMIGWMQSWDSKIIPENQSWNGMMTIPRELHLKDGQLIQNPVKELEKYYTNSVEYLAISLSGNVSLEKISGRVLDLELEIIDGDYRTLEIQFAKNENYLTSCKYEANTGIITFDRTYSGLCRDAVCVRKMQLPKSKQIKIRLLLDQYSAEIFINDGQQVMSSVFFTPLEAKKIEFFVDGEITANIIKHDIEV